MSVENLSQIYEDKLKPQLFQLEKDRLKLLRTIYFLTGSILILIISAFLNSEKELSGSVFTLIPIIITAIASIFFGTKTYGT